MKKWFRVMGLFTVIALSVALLATVVLAQGPASDGTTPVGPTDEDGDGVCDVCGRDVGEGFARGWRSGGDGETRGNGRQFVDEDGDGVCDNMIDEDGDGVCDLRGSADRGRRNGGTGGAGQRFVDEDGDGVCDNFVDEDGDGVCDECGASAQTGRGPMGGGRRGGGGMGSRMGRR